MRNGIPSDTTKWLDRWAGPLAVALSVVVLVLSLIGSMYAG